MFDAAQPDADLNNSFIPEERDCPGDLNADRRVNSDDLALLLSLWEGPDPLAHLANSGVVGPSDLSVFLGAWQTCD